MSNALQPVRNVRLRGGGTSPNEASLLAAPLTSSQSDWPSIGMNSTGRNATRRGRAGAPFEQRPRCRLHTFSHWKDPTPAQDSNRLRGTG